MGCKEIHCAWAAHLHQCLVHEVPILTSLSPFSTSCPPGSSNNLVDALLKS